MCEYCNTEYKNQHGKPLLDDDECESYLTLHKQIDGRIFIQYDQTHAQREIGYIKFCPMCGRKLESDTTTAEQ